MKSKLIQYILLFMLTGCSTSDKIYDFYPVRPQQINKGKVSFSIIGTWVNKNTYSSPYNISIIYNSSELGALLKIDSLIIINDLTKNIIYENKNIIIKTEKPETVLRDNTRFIGVKKLSKVQLDQNKYTINMEVALPNKSKKKLLFSLKPLFRDEKKSIRAILAN